MIGRGRGRGGDGGKTARFSRGDFICFGSEAVAADRLPLKTAESRIYSRL